MKHHCQWDAQLVKHHCLCVLTRYTTSCLPLSGETAYNAVLAALKAGYRHIDTAALYKNEEDVGRALRDSGVQRSEVFVTSKLWAMGLPDGASGYEYALQEAEKSLRRLGTYLDLYLIHSPHHPSARLDMWRALVELKQSGRVRSIGVSNYGSHHIDEIIASGSSVVPAVNQVDATPLASFPFALI
jgi:diketogulonate reductase-like aldo/keto reductase